MKQLLFFRRSPKYLKIRLHIILLSDFHSTKRKSAMFAIPPILLKSLINCHEVLNLPSRKKALTCPADKNNVWLWRVVYLQQRKVKLYCWMSRQAAWIPKQNLIFIKNYSQLLPTRQSFLHCTA